MTVKRRAPTYHGKPCRRCGGTERYVNGKVCVAVYRHSKNFWSKAAKERLAMRKRELLR